MHKIIKNALILTAITLVAGVCLGFVYDITKGPIEAQQNQEKEEAYQAVFPGMASMEPVYGLEAEEDAVKVSEEAAKALEAEGLGDRKVEEAYLAADEKGQILGVVMNVTTSGYGGEINFSMGIQKDGTVNGIEILSIGETAGLGMRATEDEFQGQFAGKNVERFTVTKSGAASDSEIDAISGATITSNGMTDGVNAGICYFQSLTEGGILDE